MEKHHRDALVTGTVGVLCGAVIGTGYMGFLAPVLAKDHAADWFSGLGTWVVGVAAAILTVQWNRSTALRDRERHDRQVHEEQLRSEAAERAASVVRRREAKVELAAWNGYRATLSRLTLPAKMFDAHSLRLGFMTPEQGISLVTTIVSTLPKPEINHFFLLSSDEMVSLIAALDVMLANCHTLCEKFMAVTYVQPAPLDAIPMQDQSRRLLRDILEVAQGMESTANELAKATDELRPEVPSAP